MLLLACPFRAESAEGPTAPRRRGDADLGALLAHVKAHPDDRAALKDYLVTAANELKLRVNKRDADGAIELANTIDGVRSGIATVYFARGRAYALKNEQDNALADYRAARTAADQANKPRPEIDIAIGNLCMSRGDHEGALTALRDYKNHGGTIDAVWYLALIGSLEKTHDTERLLETVKEAHEKFPENPQIVRWYEKYARALKAQDKEASMAQGGTLHFAIKFQDVAEDSTAKARVEKALEYAYDKVTRDLGHIPSRVVNVIIYANREDYEANGEVAHWVGAHYDPQDGGIRVGLTNTKMSEGEFTGYLVHEFTHLILDEITQHRIPSWLTEGIAQIEQDRDMSDMEQKLKVLLKRPERIPPLSRFVQEITGGGAVEPLLGYAIAWSFTKHLQDTWGASSMGTVLGKLGQKYSFEEAAASDYDSLAKKWVESEKARLNVP